MELQSGYSTPSVLPSHRSTLPHSRRLVVVVASASSSRPPPSPSSVQFPVVARRPHCWSWPRGLRALVIFFGVYFGASIWLQHPVGSAFPSIDPTPFALVGCRRRVGVVVASASVAVVGAVPRRRTSSSLLELAPWPEGSCHIFWSIFWSFSLALPSHRLTLLHPRRLVVVVTSALSVLTAICFSVCFGQCDTCFFSSGLPLYPACLCSAGFWSGPSVAI